VTVYDDSRNAVDTYPFAVEAGDSYTVQAGNLGESDFYEAVLHVDGDALEADNVMWSVPLEQDEVHMNLVSETSHHFLTQALSLHPHVRLERLDELPRQDLQQGDIWIFEETLPETLPEGNILLLNPQEKTPWIDVQHASTVREAAQVKEEDHPLLDHVAWEEVFVAEAVQLNETEGEGLLPLVQAGDQHLLSVREIEGRQIVIVGFDLTHSDFPLQTSFPIFVANMIEWLSPVQSAPLGQASPGETLSVPLTPGFEQHVIVEPDGSRTELTAAESIGTYEVPNKLGLYRVEERKQSEEVEKIRYFSVQMPERESDIEPAEIRLSTAVADESIEQEESEDQDENEVQAESGEQTENESQAAGGDQVEDGEAISDAQDAENDAYDARPFVFWLTLAVLAVSFLEWGVYVRGY
jgi:Ca-activated chloride channel homolog